MQSLQLIRIQYVSNRTLASGYWSFISKGDGMPQGTQVVQSSSHSYSAVSSLADVEGEAALEGNTFIISCS